MMPLKALCPDSGLLGFKGMIFAEDVGLLACFGALHTGTSSAILVDAYRTVKVFVHFPEQSDICVDFQGIIFSCSPH
jgi:hypothetical protein